MKQANKSSSIIASLLVGLTVSLAFSLNAAQPVLKKTGFKLQAKPPVCTKGFKAGPVASNGSYVCISEKIKCGFNLTAGMAKVKNQRFQYICYFPPK